jgi:hypothetical protein
MFCKVCFDASKSGYNTHNVRDYASNVVCPLLLNTKCNNCGYFGHTTKYCKIGGVGSVKKAPIMYTKSVKLVPVKLVPVKLVPVKLVPAVVEVASKNMFAGMICSDAEEEEDSDEEVMDFENDPIIWGIGLTSMVGKRWADVVGC